jgi:hypothetical protein
MQQPIQSMQLDKYAHGTRAWWQAVRIRHAAAVELFTCENKTSPVFLALRWPIIASK